MGRIHRSLPILCLYTAGSNLMLQYTPEGSACARPIEVNIIKAFAPSTVAQTLLVQATDPSLSLPAKLVLKLVDPRFSTPDIYHGYGRNVPWNAAVDDPFKALLSNLLAMDRWEGISSSYGQEVSAFRALSSLQGLHIPRFYGTCRYTVVDGSPNLDPLIANVDGLLIEYINGTPMDKLTVVTDISEADAERVSQGVLHTMRRIRDLKVIYDDVAARNLIFRHDDFDHPVLIDFGSALLKPLQATDDERIETLRGYSEVKDADRCSSRRDHEYE
ncbi:hypothetical protein EW146_g2360 [Bondarzewia mesenterica]|uniref:Protein kinase domain-containing protein n=1 Tax=Bondarzewia mesenterica TaxID=1095465 RepID=A0A4S4M0W9_9AGAM|nr:hypothetical protein EW146_g2360 [Bondarzewia mesenterica]